jgi:hypothetical protein
MGLNFVTEAAFDRRKHGARPSGTIARVVLG